MDGKEVGILAKIYEELTNGYWDVGDARKYTAMVFPFIEPDTKVRDALKALNCKCDKDERFRESRRSIEQDKDSHFLMREFERLFEREGYRYKKLSPDDDRRDLRDFAMLMIPTLAAQKSSINITLDVGQLNETVYGECKVCPIRENCKESFPVLTEFITTSLKKLGFEMNIKKA